MPTELLALVASYFLCSAAAEKQMLSKDQSTQCSAILTQLTARFADMRGADEAIILAGPGYDSYHSWLADNPRLAAELRAEAQSQLAMLQF